MAIEKEKFFEIINEVSKSKGLNKDNLLKRIGSELKGINPGSYSTYNNLKIDKLFMIQDSDKTVNCMLLHLAVECNSIPIVKLLLEKKVKVDEQMSGDVNSKFTALHIAALHDHQEIVQLLLNNNANPSLKDSQGRTPRDIVGDVESKKAIIKMLEEGEQRYVEARTTRRQTYRQGTLLQPNNKTPENLALNGNNVTAAVQAWGAKHQEENSRITPNNKKVYVQDEDEHTSSNSITNENNINKVDDTVEREQAIRERDAVDQKRIEHDDLHNQHPEQYTTYNGEQTFLNKSNSDDSGIYFDADESEALGQSILENGEDINAQDENGLTFLHRAAANNNEESVKFLVECGAKVDVQDKDGWTPLHYAAAYGCVKIAEYLVVNEANVNAQDKVEYTPLCYALGNDKKESANLLIKHGADRSLIKDEDLIDRLNKLSEVVSSTSSHSKTHNATETPEEAEKVKKSKVKSKELRAQLKEENQSLKRKIQDLESEKATLKDKLDKTKTKEVLLEKKQKELKNDIAGQEARLEALEQEVQEPGNENTKLNGELAESKSCIARYETKLKQFNKENESLRQKMQELESKNATLNSELEKTKTKRNEVPSEKAQKELEELRNCVTGHETKLEALEKLNEENESLKQKIQKLGNENTKLKDKLDKTEGQHSKTEASLEKTQKELEESKSCIARYETKLKQFNKENESLRQEIKSLENENTTLKGTTKTKTDEVSLEKTGKRQMCFLKVASVNLVTMLAVGAIFSIAFQLPVLLTIATFVVSALIASGVTYAISTKPTTELKEVDIQGLAQHGVCKT